MKKSKETKSLLFVGLITVCFAIPFVLITTIPPITIIYGIVVAFVSSLLEGILSSEMLSTYTSMATVYLSLVALLGATIFFLAKKDMSRFPKTVK